MPITTITQYVDAVYDYLMGVFKDYRGFAYKCGEGPDDGTSTSKPIIYKYLMPSSDLVDDYPVKSPCIVITVDGNEGDNNYNLSIHLCVKYESIANKEKVNKVEGSDNLFEFETESGYDTISDTELYKSSLLFTEFIHNKLCMNTELGITEIISELPEATLPDFPYCVSAVSFKAQINRFKVAQNPYHDLY